jgi:GMP synthase (glutamine-hydrolysing)
MNGRGSRWVLIVKAGSTFPSLRARKGDFEHWMLAGMGAPESEADVVDVEKGAALPEHGAHAAVVITGSHCMVTDRLPWSERAAAWLAEEVRDGTPVLGVCYGHQLLAHALGGQVAYNPQGREFGTVEIRLEPEAEQDALFIGLPRSLPVQASHMQSVVRLPPKAVRLAGSALDANHAVRYAPSAWGVQFHPEFDADAMRAYVDHTREQLAAEGTDAERLLGGIDETPSSREILARFARYALARR